MEVFQSFFEGIVLQCVEAGLVDGSEIFVDSSLVDADASNASVIDTRNLRHQLHKNYKQLEARLEEKDESIDASRAYVKQHKRYISSTDPDAAIVNRGKPKLSYQVHRAVDGKHEIITATEATAGDINEAHLMIPLIEQHKVTTGLNADTVVADSKYGTIDNFLACMDRGIQAHMPDLREVAAKRADRQDIFTEERFRYSSDEDVYYCPAGQKLTPGSLHMSRQSRDYGAPKRVCAACHLQEQCTKNKAGRTIKRHLRQDDLDNMLDASRSAKAKRDRKTRQHLMERSFAKSTRYDFDRARWRGLWRMRIQEYLICAIQNIQALISHVYRPNRKAGVMAAKGGNFSIGLSSCLIAQLISDALKIDIQGGRYYETLCMEEAERQRFGCSRYLGNSPYTLHKRATELIGAFNQLRLRHSLAYVKPFVLLFRFKEIWWAILGLNQ